MQNMKNTCQRSTKEPTTLPRLLEIVMPNRKQWTSADTYKSVNNANLHQ